MIWFTSDWHIGHENVIEYDTRPFDNSEHMVLDLVANYNRLVKKEDIVYFLGDFGSWNKETNRSALGFLNGTKILIRGNHDFSSAKCRSLGFDAVLERAVISIGKRHIRLSHYPYELSLWQQLMSKNLDKRKSRNRPKDDGKWMLHGHTHTGYPIVNNRQINVNVCYWDYKPVNVDQILSIINKESK